MVVPNITAKQLRELLERRLPGSHAHVVCDDELNSAEVIASGRIFALVEIPQGPAPWNPIVSARIAVDSNERMRGIILRLRSEPDGSEKKSSKKETD